MLSSSTSAYACDVQMMIVIQVLRVASRVLKKSLNFLLCGFFLADVHEFDHEVQASLPTLSQ